MVQKNFPIIHITGFPGVGKTALVGLLAKRLDIPVYYGTYKGKQLQQVIREAEWLLRALSHQRWRNCILEATALDVRGEFLRKTLRLDQIITIKLEASKEVLYKRLRLKAKEREQSDDRMFGKVLSDTCTFVDQFYEKFQLLPAPIRINTENLTKVEVFHLVLKELRTLGLKVE